MSKLVMQVLFILTALFAFVAFGQDKLGAREGELRLLPKEFDFGKAAAGGTGTSGVTGIQTIVLKGDPGKPGLYTIMLKVPPHTRIEAHDHPDDRVATVVSGTWLFGYGDRFGPEELKALTPGSFYTEPSGKAHFAQTLDSDVVLHITGYGPSGMHYRDAPGTPKQ